MKKPIIALAIAGIMATSVAVPVSYAEEVTQVKIAPQRSISHRIKSFESKEPVPTTTVENNGNSTVTTKIRIPQAYSPSKLFWFSAKPPVSTSITPTSTTTKEDAPTTTKEDTPITTKQTTPVPPTTSTLATPTTTSQETTPMTTKQDVPDIAPYEKAVKDAQEEYDKVSEKYDGLLENRDSLTSEVDDLKEQLGSVNSKIDALKKENSDINARITQLNTEKDRLIKERDSLNKATPYTVEQKQAIVAQAIEEMINDYRVKNGFHKLVVHPDVKKGAQDWSASMARNSTFMHFEGFAHSPASTRVEISGENIVAINLDGAKQGKDLTEADLNSIAKEMFEEWRKSSGHNDTMLDPTVQIMGVGVVFDKGSVFATTGFNNERFIMDGYSAPRGMGGSAFPQHEANMYKAYIPQGAKEKIGLQGWSAPKDLTPRYVYTSEDIMIGGGPNKQIDRFTRSATVGSDPKISLDNNKSKIESFNKQIDEKAKEISSLNEKSRSNITEITKLGNSKADLEKKIEEKESDLQKLNEDLSSVKSEKNKALNDVIDANNNLEDFKKKYGG